MQVSNIPVKFPIPFANSAGGGYIRSVPTASQIGITNGAASLTDGYPPLNSVPQASGGVPPFLQDTNGILNQTTAWSRWFSAGGPVAWDSTFSAAVGGYPKGAVVMSATTFGLAWISTADNNTTNPDSGGANWQARGGWSGSILTASGTFTVPPTVSLVKVRAVGGGGGGANCAPSSGNYVSGAGGGAGGYAEGIYLVTPGAGISVTIGGGGAAQANGGNTLFGSFLTCYGGGGASFQATVSSAGAPGGTATGATGTLITETGGYGSDGQNGTFYFAGNGASGPWGGGGRAGFQGGLAAVANGAGGGGAYATSGSYNGGAGAAGLVIVEWFA